eukprot:4233093-Pleurochrysis_carterae.AAC.2
MGQQSSTDDTGCNCGGGTELSLHVRSQGESQLQLLQPHSANAAVRHDATAQMYVLLRKCAHAISRSNTRKALAPRARALCSPVPGCRIYRPRAQTSHAQDGCARRRGIREGS